MGSEPTGEEQDVADESLLGWEETRDAPVPRAAEAPPADALDAALAAYRGIGLPWERVVLDLHSGRILGRLGPWLMDAAAVALRRGPRHGHGRRHGDLLRPPRVGGAPIAGGGVNAPPPPAVVMRPMRPGAADSVNQRLPVTGCQSKPTVFRTPWAYISGFVPSGSTT